MHDSPYQNIYFHSSVIIIYRLSIIFFANNNSVIRWVHMVGIKYKLNRIIKKYFYFFYYIFLPWNKIIPFFFHIHHRPHKIYTWCALWQVKFQDLNLWRYLCIVVIVIIIIFEVGVHLFSIKTFEGLKKIEKKLIICFNIKKLEYNWNNQL